MHNSAVHSFLHSDCVSMKVSPMYVTKNRPTLPLRGALRWSKGKPAFQHPKYIQKCTCQELPAAAIYTDSDVNTSIVSSVK